jgi:hypothetical protein
MSTLREFTLTRLGEDDTGWRGFARAEAVRVLNINDQIRAEHAQISADNKLSALGKQDAVRQVIVKLAPQLVRAKHAIDTIKAKIVDRKSKMKPPAPDPVNAAAAVLRSELRAHVRALKPGERMQLLIPPSGAEVDPVLVAAVLESPWSAGIDEHTREQLTNAALAKRYPTATAEIEQAENTIEVLDAATLVTERAIFAAGDFPSEKIFTDFIAGALPSMAHIDAELNRSFSFSTLADVA